MGNSWWTRPLAVNTEGATGSIRETGRAEMESAGEGEESYVLQRIKSGRAAIGMGPPFQPAATAVFGYRSSARTP